ncbi:threonine ammonia-lyase, biosynthetic [Salinisphaera hydrothermalis]|uniref:L-threonine dehydratase n=1 Tax=Salinisphaera hydrothermalis (strain C41B8) TaxID=1304275 RepID=A0A084IKY9_SALHC|nr:threonine ammonia-lyase, biosynthetic [Salinisphaera hydrothermalis]KEZ77373.1 threonine dehydratase [Salinisphaera hydrothermalis C41B8]
MNSSLKQTALSGSAPAVDVGDAEYLKRINAARVYDVAIETPLVEAAQLSARIGNRLFLKREDLQPVHSFKLRGAYNKISHLTEEEKARGVICASAGNHAQGVALAGRNLGIRAVIVMPRTTPQIKVSAVAGFGGEIVLHGDGYDEAAAHAAELMERDGLVYIHPYDDPYVIAGQGTIGMEIVRQHPQPIHAVFVCVGGGGMLAGVAAYIKSVRPDIRVIGVEPEDAASMGASLAAGERVALDEVGLFADGVAVKKVGEETFRVCQRHVDAMMTVSIDEMCAAIRDVYEDTRALTEPAGVLAVAGAKKYAAETGIENEDLVAITSGANVNFDRLSYIAERAELGEQREALLAVTMPEKPGSFLQFCRTIGDRSITEFGYRYADDSRAQIFAGIKLTNGIAERDALIDTLQNAGYDVLDMSRNEMAKLHVRHMVGGRAAGAGSEVLFRVEFPERPGALLRFLEAMGDRWNISLFHYRNHGHAHGLVLLGIQVALEDRAACRAALDSIGYDYAEETDNPVYQRFLQAG